jgi:DNA-binding NarL/FixJ family response regulator
VSNIFEKLGVENRNAAAMQALETLGKMNRPI